MFHHNHDEGPPCRNMEALLQQVAEGSATGWRRWYALAHAARCSHCGTFLERMKLTIHALRDVKSVNDEEALSRLRAKLEQLTSS